MSKFAKNSLSLCVIATFICEKELSLQDFPGVSIVRRQIFQSQLLASLLCLQSVKQCLYKFIHTADRSWKISCAILAISRMRQEDIYDFQGSL